MKDYIQNGEPRTTITNGDFSSLGLDLPKVTNLTATSGALARSHAGKLLYLGDPDASITVTDDATAGWQHNTQIVFSQAGTTPLTFSPGSGVTIRSFNGLLSTAGQYAVATLIRLDSNEWLLIGQLA